MVTKGQVGGIAKALQPRKATQAEMEAGTSSSPLTMTPLGVSQAITALGGAGGRVTSWKTVGTDASDDYATVSAALDDGEYSIIVTGSITESVGVAALPDEDVRIEFESPDITWTFAAGIQILAASYTKGFQVFLNGATITWGNSTSISPIDLSASTGYVGFYGGGNITNTSTAATTPVVESTHSQVFIGRYHVTAANVQNGGIRCSSRSFYADSIKVTGGGSSCYDALVVNSTNDSSIGNIEVSGTFSTSSSQYPFQLSYNVVVGSVYANLGSSGTDILLSSPVKSYKQNNTNAAVLSATAQVDLSYQSNGSATVEYSGIYQDRRQFKSVDSSGTLIWSLGLGKAVFKKTSTTDATKTELFLDASSLQLLLWTDDIASISARLISVRDNQDYATFFVPTFTASNDGGTMTVTAPGTIAGLTPDDSIGTGSTLTVDIEADNTNNAPSFYVTANASENWDHRLVVTINRLNN